MCWCTKAMSLSLPLAVFSVDYEDDLDTLVSGSADFSVKVWSLSAGACLNTLTGHTEWVTKVNLPINLLYLVMLRIVGKLNRCVYGYPLRTWGRISQHFLLILSRYLGCKVICRTVIVPIVLCKCL